MSSSQKQRVDAVILDLGNVLVFHDNEQLFRSFGELAGLDSGAVSRLFPSSLWNAIHSGELDSKGIRAEICRALGVELSDRDFDRVWNSHFTRNEAMLPWVESLVGRVKLLLLSNTNPIHMDYLMRELPLLRSFDHLLLSHRVKKMKPDPAIFLEALRRAGSLPERTVFFDDIPEYVQAAQQLGIRAYVFRRVDEFAAQLEALGLR